MSHPYKIKHNVPPPSARFTQGQLGDVEKLVEKMRKGDLLEFPNYNELIKYVQRARRFSRWHKKNSWLFRISCVAGKYRMWRVA